MRKGTQVLWLCLLVGGVTVVLAAPGRGAPKSHDVTIVSRQFEPKEVTVEVGEEVTWTNKDPGKVHSVTADDGSFDSSPECSNANPGACLDSRDQFTHAFGTEGQFPYHSKTTGGPGGQGTSGVVVVVPAGTPAPTAEPCPSTSSTTAGSPQATSPC